MLWMDVDAALAEVPVNEFPLVDADLAIQASVAYNAAGMDLVWNFVTPAGAQTQTAVTPTNSGDYLWTSQGKGLYSIQAPASAGGTINNNTEGFGWFTGVATGILPWKGPTIGFRAAGLNNLLVESAYSTTRGLAGTALPNADAEAAGGLYTRGSGAGQINQAANGQVDANTVRIENTDATDQLATALAAGVITGAVVDDALNSATTFETNLSQATNDHFLDAWLVFTSGTLSGQVKKITDYDGSTKFVTVSGGFTAEPTAADAFQIINGR
jgi:hypothetical protein